MAPSEDSITASYATEKGKIPDNAVCFASHKQDYANYYMSNSYLAPFKDDNGITYTCGEAYFQAGKAWLIRDKAKFIEIAHAKDGKVAKDKGNALEGLDVQKWNSISRAVMCNTLYFKFRNEELLKRNLLTTGDLLIVEARDDRVWGTGLKGFVKARTTRIDKWPGENKLGEELMRIRAYFFKEEKLAKEINERNRSPSPDPSSGLVDPISDTKETEDITDKGPILTPQRTTPEPQSREVSPALSVDDIVNNSDMELEDIAQEALRPTTSRKAPVTTQVINEDDRDSDIHDFSDVRDDNSAPASSSKRKVSGGKKQVGLGKQVQSRVSRKRTLKDVADEDIAMKHTLAEKSRQVSNAGTARKSSLSPPTTGSSKPRRKAAAITHARNAHLAERNGNVDDVDDDVDDDESE